MSTPLVFVSYSHRDATEQEQLCGHLQVLPDLVLDVWSDTRIRSGQDWETEIEQALDRATVAVLLITRDFLNSAFIRDKEVPRMLERYAAEELTIVPVIARSCPWNLVPWLAKVQALPPGGAPVWSDDPTRRAEEPLTHIAREIHNLITAQDAASTMPSATLPMAATSGCVERVNSADGGAIDARNGAERVRSVVAGFRNNLVAARERMMEVMYYKNLHDELHAIHTRCYRQLADNARWFPGNDAVRTTFFSIQADLESSVGELKRIDAAAPGQLPRASWIGLVDEAGRNLAAANDNADPVLAERAIRALGRVMAKEPGKLDVSLNNAARDVKADQLVRSLQAACVAVTQSRTSSHLETELGRGTRELVALAHEWSTLVDQHRGWEDVETTLRMIDESLRASLDRQPGGDDLAELRATFTFLTDTVSALLSQGAGDTLQRLAVAHDKLRDALARDDIAGTRNRYVSFRSLAARKFDSLDRRLKELCGQMVQLGDRFELLLGES
jgi:hypothetical protein